jgi:hypothetical protein
MKNQELFDECFAIYKNYLDENEDFLSDAMNLYLVLQNARKATNLVVSTNIYKSAFTQKIENKLKNLSKKIIGTSLNEPIREKIYLEASGYSNMLASQDELFFSNMIPKIHTLCSKYKSEVFRLHHEGLLVVKPTFKEWDKVAQMFQDKDSEEGLLLNGELLGYPRVPGFRNLRTKRDVNVILKSVDGSKMIVQLTAYKCLPDTKHTFPDLKKIAEAMKDIIVIIKKKKWAFEKVFVE